MHTNRLANEKSPYLLQHAHNPVDWYAWGPEAFEKARSENKPIFLSIGYSTCHWCHVMERESFENEKIADLLNRDYISIKVDREERPDVDRIYMTFVQATTGSGGWPMSVWLTPELKPFYGGTYFPPENRWGNPGFAAILTQISSAWESDREKIDDSARDVIEQLKKSSKVEGRAGGGRIDASLLETGFSVFRRTFDTRLGGFGGAPKFPRPSVHNFLLRYYSRTKNQEALDMVLLTLREMAKGGMNDQLGGGFHRYSVDERWFVPHFEKMLYDQGQLVTSYVEAFQITGDVGYAATARRTLDYVLRDMTDPGGEFYSAEDADSVIDPGHPDEKGEGAFYIWSAEEVRALLPDSAGFMRRYGVREGGNVEYDPHGEFTGKNILYLADETAAGGAADQQAAAILLETRGKRPRPHLDDKILTAWNGLMISAFALAGAALKEPRYAEAARRAAAFLIDHMYVDGKLLRRYRAGDAAIPAFLDDYALFVQALLDLYEAQFDPRHLQLAIDLTLQMRERFEDLEHGGFFSSPAGDESLVMRVKDDYDGAEPSGNSVALMNLLRLTQMTNRDEFRQSAARALAAFEQRLSLAPSALPQMLAACEFLLSNPRQIVVAGDRNAPDTAELLQAIHARFMPNRVVLLIDSEETRARLAQDIPEVAAMQRRRRTGGGIRLPRLRVPIAGFGRGGIRRVATIRAHPTTGGVMERAGATTLKGNPFTLVGPELKAGDAAPDFNTIDNTLKPVTLKDTGGNVRIISVIPSLDTPVCDAQTKRFNEEAAKLPDVDIITVSMDLPFAQKRWCNDFQVDRVKMLSDHKDASFGEGYGTLIKELRIESRAIFVLDRDNKVRHAEYVKEVADHPDYEAALAAARKAASAHA